MRWRSALRLVLITAIASAALAVGAGPVAASSCAAWNRYPFSGRVGDEVSVAGPTSNGDVHGDTADVGLGSTILASAPIVNGSISVTFVIPNGTPVGDTTVGMRTRTSGTFGFGGCAWSTLPFTVLPSFILSSSTTAAPAQTTTTTAAPAHTGSTTSTLASSGEEAPVTSTTTSVAATTTVAVTTTVAPNDSSTTVAAALFSDSSRSGGLPSIVVAILGAVGGVALFAGGMLFQRRMTGN